MKTSGVDKKKMRKGGGGTGNYGKFGDELKDRDNLNQNSDD